ncbi:MAG: hypothetical protein ATN35_04180 [Epulopiscium sp. Nele67-Bin004]|nr:MAG: hypothetical protein ATN35_04180 [Epulopiscium sp. Nele67-Bin004]
MKLRNKLMAGVLALATIGSTAPVMAMDYAHYYRYGGQVVEDDEYSGYVFTNVAEVKEELAEWYYKTEIIAEVGSTVDITGMDYLEITMNGFESLGLDIMWWDFGYDWELNAINWEHFDLIPAIDVDFSDGRTVMKFVEPFVGTFVALEDGGKGDIFKVYVTIVPQGDTSYNGVEVEQKAIVVNGESKSIRGCSIYDTTYISLRDFSDLLTNTNKSFEIGWNDLDKQIELSSESEINTGFESEYVAHRLIDMTSISANGQWARLYTYSVDGTTYFKLRDIANIFGVEIGWDATAGIIVTAE